MSERVLEINDLHVSFDIEAGEVQAVRGLICTWIKVKRWPSLESQVQGNLLQRKR